MPLNLVDRYLGQVLGNLRHYDAMERRRQRASEIGKGAWRSDNDDGSNVSMAADIFQGRNCVAREPDFCDFMPVGLLNGAASPTDDGSRRFVRSLQAGRWVLGSLKQVLKLQVGVEFIAFVSEQERLPAVSDKNTGIMRYRKLLLHGSALPFRPFPAIIA